jgi:hypothetical protein
MVAKVEHPNLDLGHPPLAGRRWGCLGRGQWCGLTHKAEVG